MGREAARVKGIGNVLTFKLYFYCSDVDENLSVCSQNFSDLFHVNLVFNIHNHDSTSRRIVSLERESELSQFTVDKGSRHTCDNVAMM